MTAKPGPVDLAREPAFVLGRAQICPATREVVAGDGREVLEPRVMQVLVVLYQARGEVVSRDALIARCWAGRVVGDDAINRCIGRIRRLSERHGGFLLETIPRIGHRLLISDEAPASVSAPPPPHFGKWRLPLLAALAFAVVAGGLAYWWWTLRAEQAVTVRPPPRLSIAVLPFTPLYNDSEAQNFGDSIASAVADQLSSGTRFQIISPAKSFGFRGAAKARAHQALHADFLIDGEVRRSPGWVTASIRLIDGRSGNVLRTEAINRTLQEAGRLPDHVATTVAGFGWVAAFGFGPNAHWDQHAMAVHLQVVDKAARGDPSAAYELARRLAAELPDDAFAVHEPSVVIYYLSAAVPLEKRQALVAQARAYAEKAIRLDPEYGEPYIQLQSNAPDLTWAEREGLLRKALALSPDTIYGRLALVELLHNTGRFHDAEPIAEYGLAHAPYYESLYMKAINSRVWMRRPGEAHSLIERGIDIFPHRGGFFAKMFEATAFNGDLAGAEKLLNDAVVRRVYYPDAPPVLYGIVIDALKHRRPAQEVVDACKAIETRPYEIRQTCLVALVALGRLDDAFRLTDVLFPSLQGATPDERAKKWLMMRYFPSAYLLIPATAPLRSDPRFAGIVERIGLIAYWKTARIRPDFCASEKVPVCALLARS